MESILFERNFIRQEIPKLDRIFALQEAQKEKIKNISGIRKTDDCDRNRI